jgi:hypothetical protein
MKNKLLFPVLLVVALFLVITFWGKTPQMAERNPVTNLRTSLLGESEISEMAPSPVTPAVTEESNLILSVGQLLQSLQKSINDGIRTKTAAEFVIATGKKLTDVDYVIPENTCQNGVRILAKANMEDLGEAATPMMTITGLNRKKSRATFARELTFTKETPWYVFHLPSSLIEDDDTVFPEYKVSKGRFTETVEYDVACY